VSGLRSDYPTERASGIAGDKVTKRGTALFNGGIVAVSDAFRPEPSIVNDFNLRKVFEQSRDADYSCWVDVKEFMAASSARSLPSSVARRAGTQRGSSVSTIFS
jgi:hypothetical protein